MSKKVKKQKTVEELLEEALVPEEEQSYEVPENWVWTNLGSVLKLSYGKALPKKNRSGEGYPVFGSNGIVGYHLDFFIEGPVIVVGRKGSHGEVNWFEKSGWPIDTTYYVEVSKKLDLKFYYYLLKTLNLQRLNRSTAIPGLNREDAYSQPIPLPPLNEQTRIADKVERLLNKIYEAKQLISPIPDIINNFRKKIISNAISGNLTQHWRVKNGEIESATDSLMKLFIKQKQQTKGVKKGYSPTVEEHYIKKWAVTKIEYICEMQLGKMLSRKAYSDDLIMLPYLRNANVQWGKFDLSDVFEMGFKEDEVNKYSLQKGDLLVCEGGEVGRTAIWNEEIQLCMYQKALHRLRCNNKFILSKWIYYFMLECHSSGEFEKQTSQTTIRHLTQEKLKKISIPIPPLKEQIEIVNKVEKYLNVADEVEEKYNEVEERILNVEKSILHKAFRGELGTNDPTEESAIELLKEVLHEQVK